jgi:acetyltransferase-like isoleucine patch superfamily enzyme
MMKHRILDVVAVACALPAIALRSLQAPLSRFANLVKARTKLSTVRSTVQFDGRVDIAGTANITIGDFTRIGDGVQLGTEQSGRLCIGEHVRVNRGVTIVAYGELVIGDYTMIGEFASIRDANHMIRKGSYIRNQPHEVKPVKIGSDVWIGRGVCVLPGVTIGNGSVIGANSVVTKSLPENVVAVGAPAKVVRER